MLDLITSRTWWSAAGRRALRTLLVTLVPFLPVLLTSPTSDQLVRAASTLAIAALLSLATSLASLPELGVGAVSWWVAIMQRAARTAAQVLAAGLATAVVVQDVPWLALLSQALAAAAGTVVLALIDRLPETIPTAVPASDVVAQVGPAGLPVAGPASVYPNGAPVALYRPVDGPKHAA